MPSRQQLSLKKSIQVLAAVIFSLTAFSSVHAAPITVTGGLVLVNGPNFGPSITSVLNGPNFGADVFDTGGADHFGYFGISPCSRSVAPLIGGPCTGANLGYNGIGEWRGPVAFNGIFFMSDVVNNLNLTINSPSWIIPPELLDDAAVKITAPFTLTGFGAGPILGLQTIELQGQGTVVLFLTRQTVGGFTGLFLDRAEYFLGPTVQGVTIESVPEPATLILLFSGLAGVAARVRQRSRRLH